MKLCWYCALFPENHNTLTIMNREIHESLSVLKIFTSIRFIILQDLKPCLWKMVILRLFRFAKLILIL